MRIFIFAFGKLKTPGLREAANYYQRLSRSWVPIQEIELKPQAVPQKNPSLRAQIQAREGQILFDRIQTEIPSGKRRIILLDETGKNKSTQQWAQVFEQGQSNAVTSTVFCMGSSLGFSEDVRNRSHEQMSFGLQTLPHELARVVLFEQIFRAYSVLHGHPYHNEGS